MDIRRVLAIGRRWLPLFIASVLLAGGAAYALSSLQQKTYEAQAKLIVGQSLSSSSPDYTQLLTSQLLSSTYASIATTSPVLEAVVSELGLDLTPDELRNHVAAGASTGSTLLSITAQDSDPEVAAAIANAVAKRLVAASQDIQGRQQDIQASVDADLAATQAQIVATQARVTALAGQPSRTAAEESELSTLEGRLVTLRSTYATLVAFSSSAATNLISIVEPAAVPTAPISPRPLLNTLLGAILGLLIAVGFVFMAEYLNDAVRGSEDIEAITGLSTLGTIGRIKGSGSRSEMYQLSALLYPRSAVTEAYRTLRTNLEFAAIDAPIHSLLVTSARDGEGKTVTAANLAVVFAQAGRQVLLVDGDLRRPGVQRVFNLSNAEGLTTLLRNEDAVLRGVAIETEQSNLRVLTTGPLPPNPAELLGSQRVRAILEQASSEFDLVIIDSPPVQAVADAAILSSLTDGTLLVIDATRSRRRSVRLAREALTRAGAHMLGAVVNRASRQSYADYPAEYGGYYDAQTGPPGPAVNTSPRQPAD